MPETPQEVPEWRHREGHGFEESDRFEPSKVVDYKPPYACYRCESNQFDITDEQGFGKMTVTCKSCGLTISHLSKNAAYGKPTVGVTMVDPDGTTYKSTDSFKLAISFTREQVEKLKIALNKHSPADTSNVLLEFEGVQHSGNGDPVHSFMLTKDFGAYECYDVETSIRSSGATVVRVKADRELDAKLARSKEAAIAETNSVIFERGRLHESIAANLQELASIRQTKEIEKNEAKAKKLRAKQNEARKIARAKKIFTAGDDSRFEEL